MGELGLFWRYTLRTILTYFSVKILCLQLFVIYGDDVSLCWSFPCSVQFQRINRPGQVFGRCRSRRSRLTFYDRQPQFRFTPLDVWLRRFQLLTTLPLICSEKTDLDSDIAISGGGFYWSHLGTLILSCVWSILSSLLLEKLEKIHPCTTAFGWVEVSEKCVILPHNNVGFPPPPAGTSYYWKFAWCLSYRFLALVWLSAWFRPVD